MSDTSVVNLHTLCMPQYRGWRWKTGEDNSSAGSGSKNNEQIEFDKRRNLPHVLRALLTPLGMSDVGVVVVVGV